MKRFAKLGLGGAQGPGSQWVSWLHVDDWVGAARFLMEREEDFITLQQVLIQHLKMLAGKIYIILEL